MWPRGCELAHPHHTPQPTLPVWYSPDSMGRHDRHRRHDSRRRQDEGCNSRHRRSNSDPGMDCGDPGMTATRHGNGRHVTHIAAPGRTGNRPASSRAESACSEASSQLAQPSRHRRHRRRPSSSPGNMYNWEMEEVYPAAAWAASRPWRDFYAPPAGGGLLTQDYRPTAPHLLAFVRSGPRRSAASHGGWGHTLDAGFGRSDSFTNNVFFQTGRQSHGPDLRHIGHTSPNRVTRVC